MIKANELRTGSMISINGEYQTVDHIKSFDNSVTIKDGFTIVFDGGNYETEESDIIKPIVLTHELLEKCGFSWSIYHQAFHYGDPLLSEFYDLTECYPSGFQLSTFKKQHLIGKPIQYLHQLQNLFFSLTGEELPLPDANNL